MTNHGEGDKIEFRKSTFSTNGGGCVEVAFVDSGVMVRDSKNRSGPVLSFTPGEWDAFMKGALAGEFG